MIPEGRTEMESLLKKYTDSNYSERWSPYSVYQYETEFQNGAYEGLSKEVRKNISYSLQYLEYIQLQFDELKLHSIIKQELWKNYIIISMSIIESIFHHLVVKGGYRKTDKWENSKPIHSNVFEEDGKKKKYIITTATELDTPREEMMDFEFLINKVKEKKLISLTGKAYPYLKALKTIRNKVHLHIIRFANDTDYVSINEYDYLMARYMLYTILRDDVFKPNDKTVLNFIKLSSEEHTKLKEEIERRKKLKEEKEEE